MWLVSTIDLSEIVLVILLAVAGEILTIRNLIMISLLYTA